MSDNYKIGLSEDKRTATLAFWSLRCFAIYSALIKSIDIIQNRSSYLLRKLVEKVIDNLVIAPHLCCFFKLLNGSISQFFAKYRLSGSIAHFKNYFGAYFLMPPVINNLLNEYYSSVGVIYKPGIVVVNLRNF